MSERIWSHASLVLTFSDPVTVKQVKKYSPNESQININLNFPSTD